MADFWDGAKQVLGVVAPGLATAVGGPLAGAATRAILSALGLDPESAPEVAAQAVKNATPEQLLALKQADQAFAVQMRQLDISVDKMSYDDTASARAREMAVRDVTPRAMGSVTLLAFFAATGAVLLGYAHADTVLAGTLIGYMSAKAEQVLAYYFGSSAGSQSKDMLLYHSTPAAGPFGRG